MLGVHTRVCNGTEIYAMYVLQNASPSAETRAVRQKIMLLNARFTL